jgi:hypothetical protein
VYDVILGVLGTALALTAAFDFKHDKVKNTASGTLGADTTVTHSEMIEHSFYQLLNLVQIVFLHSVGTLSLEHSNHQYLAYLLLILATAPWLARPLFPVNKFSDNYVKGDPWTVVNVLYRIKKYQYMFYKHFLLHGLNLSAALVMTRGHRLAETHTFRMYWVLLNTSYVMEFFMQSLVKRGWLTQNAMLNLQLLLMTAASVAAAKVLLYVDLVFCTLSLLLNIVHRKRDLINMLLLMGISVVWNQAQTYILT